MSKSDVAPPEPIATYGLRGHEALEAEIARVLAGARVHHAWMLCGPRGVGKATLAYRIARRLLGAAPAPGLGPLGSDPEDAVCRRIEAGGHADLLIIERPWDEAKGRRRGEIPVDEARKLADRFEQTSAAGGWRLAIIDAVDEMNANAANAILKTLEEPPPRALVLLIAHAPGQVPITVRSRCRRFTLTAPGEEVAAEVARAATGCGPEAAEAAAALSGGRPGVAVQAILDGGAGLLGEVGAALAGGRDAREALVERLSEAKAEAERKLAFDLVRRLALERARGGDPVGGGRLWDALRAAETDLDDLGLDPRIVLGELFAQPARGPA